MKYYVILNDVRLGPLDLAEARRLPLTPDTPVWAEGMADWAPASQVGDFADMFAGRPFGGNTPPSFGSQTQGSPFANPQTAFSPGYAPGMSNSGAMPPRPDNYLAWSIIVTLLCCLPLGIVAIIKSAAVNPAYDRGAYEEAYRASTSAKNWIITSAVIGVVVSAAYTILVMCSSIFNGALS
nr:DUF4339 domain-containing protein [Bacteroides sp.]